MRCKMGEKATVYNAKCFVNLRMLPDELTVDHVQGQSAPEDMSMAILLEVCRTGLSCKRASYLLQLTRKMRYAKAEPCSKL